MGCPNSGGAGNRNGSLNASCFCSSVYPQEVCVGICVRLVASPLLCFSVRPLVICRRLWQVLLLIWMPYWVMLHQIPDCTGTATRQALWLPKQRSSKCRASFFSFPVAMILMCCSIPPLRYECECVVFLMCCGVVFVLSSVYIYPPAV